MNQSYRILVILAAIWLSPTVWAEQKAYTPVNLAEIEHGYSNERFLVVLWELSCPPCHGELAMLGRLRQQVPEINLVLIGTDSMHKQEEVNALLATHGLTGVNSWLFAGDNKERLRYSIDPEWYGELPRNYFYDANGERIGFSGKLNEDRVRRWLSLDNTD